MRSFILQSTWSFLGLLLLLTTALLLPCLPGGMASPDVQTPRETISEGDPQAKHYIIVFKKGLDDASMSSFYTRLEDQISQANVLRQSTVPSSTTLSITHRYDYSTFRGFSALLDPTMAKGLSENHDEIEEVEEDHPMKIVSGKE
ncbi:hypothetical protein BJ684DRAFT_15335 [Piptocephalis cylindrospora]|uniref:Inhibitor I9 domain-containing protein n=1 Tax=Piptocephalis cylindrospora TaxID=1907219 RepID=A0A4P9Y5N8_9FUNG|nr:hypothetical protein BJ684DRAFT_15335 [Piptocephalis cylindrospora]|eukprot:RKP14336.1 hypothetical protein BJ684DRAFT_15335 [Piptocephalis cylindrospora]